MLYVVFLLINIKAEPRNQSILCYKKLPDLSKYTLEVLKIYQENIHEVQYCFPTSSKDKDERLLNQWNNIVDNFKKMENTEIPIMPTTTHGCMVIMRVAHLRLWTGLIELCLQNEYITARIKYKEEIKEILDYLRKYGWLDADVDDKKILRNSVDSQSTAASLISSIAWLFYFVKSSNASTAMDFYAQSHLA